MRIQVGSGLGRQARTQSIDKVGAERRDDRADVHLAVFTGLNEVFCEYL